MNSTSTSKYPILRVKNLNLSFKITNHKLGNLRDVFINMFTSPIRFLFERPKDITILEDINFEINRGEVVGLIGTNGSGKTSLCRTIAGMYGHDNSIDMNGKLRAIFDTSSVIHPELSGEENAWIITNIIYPELSKDQRAQIVKESLEFAELNEFIYSPFKTYSKGMKVRLFISIVSAKPCDLLILDEVFNGADTFFNEKISNRLTNIIKTSGAVIFISHEEQLIKDLCNRLIVLNNHKVVYDGNVEEGLELYHSNLGHL